MKIKDMNKTYVEEIRQRLNLEDPNDTSKDFLIEKMTPFERVKKLAGWHLGDDGWADTFRDWCESNGLVLIEETSLNEIESALKSLSKCLKEYSIKN